MAKLTVRFDDKTSKMLKRFAKEKGLSQVEIIRRALALYFHLCNETRDGTKRVSITSAKTDKIIKDIVHL